MIFGNTTQRRKRTEADCPWLTKERKWTIARERLRE